jgi:predicted nucleic acid-binding protein
VIVVDASGIYETLIGGPYADEVRAALADDDEHAAPHLVDAEVLGLIQRDLLRHRFDATVAGLAVEDLYAWPADRFGHRGLLARAWELRDNVRAADALYVALSEVLDATLVTLDARLARATGPRCRFVVIGS